VDQSNDSYQGKKTNSTIQRQTFGTDANNTALNFRRVIFAACRKSSNLDIASCKVKICSTAFLLGGGFTSRTSSSFSPLMPKHDNSKNYENEGRHITNYTPVKP
jgi:hypothetical protein